MFLGVYCWTCGAYFGGEDPDSMGKTGDERSIVVDIDVHIDMDYWLLWWCMQRSANIDLR